jgi:hypothetical protein
MSSTVLIFGILFQLLLGIIAPSLVLLITPSDLNKPYIKNIVAAWKFFVWGIFFINTSIFIFLKYVYGQGSGGIIAFGIGVIPFCALAAIFILQAFVRWRRRFE